MKTVRIFGLWMLVLLICGVTANAQSQRRDRGKGNDHPERAQKKEVQPDRRRGVQHDNDRDRHEYARGDSHRHRSDRYDRYYDHGRYVRYHHNRHRYASWAPAYGHRYNTRYIYYRDYNVYYDCHRDVFMTWTGRGWIVTHHVPDVIYHVDFKRVVVLGVDYWDDDFNFYLARRRPAYISIQASW